MKTLGTEQLLAMKFKRLALSEEFAGVLGNLPEVFMGIVYGESGEGKTEFCIRFAKELAAFADVKWLGYETGHAADIQEGVARNDLKGLPIGWVDPWEESHKQKRDIDSFIPPADMPLGRDMMANRLFIALYLMMNKGHSAKYWFIDSADAMNLTKQQVVWLRAKFVTKKGIIFIAHADGCKPESAVSKKIEYYAQFGILVKKYKAKAEKNRFCGFENLTRYFLRNGMQYPA